MIALMDHFRKKTKTKTNTNTKIKTKKKKKKKKKKTQRGSERKPWPLSTQLPNFSGEERERRGAGGGLKEQRSTGQEDVDLRKVVRQRQTKLRQQGKSVPCREK